MLFNRSMKNNVNKKCEYYYYLKTVNDTLDIKCNLIENTVLLYIYFVWVVPNSGIKNLNYITYKI